MNNSVWSWKSDWIFWCSVAKSFSKKRPFRFILWTFRDCLKNHHLIQMNSLFQHSRRKTINQKSISHLDLFIHESLASLRLLFNWFSQLFLLYLHRFLRLLSYDFTWIHLVILLPSSSKPLHFSNQILCILSLWWNILIKSSSDHLRFS